jgi:hypothetical protein
MANPDIMGSRISAPYLGRHVDILSETLRVRLPEYELAEWEVVYEIDVDSAGLQVPFLFVALNLSEDFQAWLDGEELVLQDIPEDLDLSDEKWQTLRNGFRELEEGEMMLPEIIWGNHNERPHLSELTYFEADLDSGRHQFRVTYRATARVGMFGSVKDYRYRYALAPARGWRSFGSLVVELDNTPLRMQLTSNLGEPKTGQLDSVATWQFSSLPEQNDLEFRFDPEPDALGRFALRVGPFGWGLIATLLLMSIHFILVVRSLKENPYRGTPSFRAIGGALLVGILSTFAFIFAPQFTYMLIGEHATGMYGYWFFLAFVVGIAILVGYTILASVLEIIVKRALIRRDKRQNPGQYPKEGDPDEA